MSYTLSLYVVPLSKLELVKVGDQRLLRKALKELQSALANYDAEMGAPDADNDVDLSHADALKEIFSGNFTEGVPGSRYGWAFKCLCSMIGYEVGHKLSPSNMATYEEMDKFLKARGLKLRFSDIILNPPPVSFPSSADWPSVGHWPRSLLEEEPQISILGIRSLQIVDPQERAAIELAYDWLLRLKIRKKDILIGFLG